MTLQALIFDVDGTLAETEDLHRHAFNQTFAAAGLDWHWTQDDYRDLLKVTGGKERMRFHRDQRREAGPDDATIATLHRDKTDRYGQAIAAGDIVLRPGVRSLVAQAREEGLALAIATTTSRANVDALIRACWRAPADEVFDVIAAGDEVDAKKPAPDVYELALTRLGVPPNAALAFEDTRNGVLSATAAGLRVVVTPSVYSAGEDFADASVVLRDLSKFKLQDWIG
ncbi:HAD-IA family hydrolase [Pseudooceanicola sp. MF1-13]|uniref:HAD-IA family hydrolase n=1 Tax=Pseudooceanicola sp. MF1-13 TaxID=3379095 RepID=UPI0038911E23